jgi:hypothetical protein
MAADRLRVVVEAHTGEAPFALHVEPWGATFDMATGSAAVVTFSGESGVPSLSVSRGPDAVIICAEGRLEDYSVEDRTGQPLMGR